MAQKKLLNLSELGFPPQKSEIIPSFQRWLGTRKGNNAYGQAAQGKALSRGSLGVSAPSLTSPLKRVPVWRLQSAGTDRQSPRGNCGFTKNRPFDQMIKSLSYANAWTGWTLGQFSRSKLQLIFEEIACSLAFPQLCHTVSHTAAFVTARTN